VNKSKQMREFFEQNDCDVSIREVADEIGVRYQYAYQVIRRYCNKNDVELPTNNSDGETKADKIRSMWDDDMTIGDIAKELNTNYTYVWSVVDKYRKNK